MDNNAFNEGLDLDALANIDLAPPVAEGEKKFRLVVDEQENELNYVVVGINGKVYQIMRGIEVTVPASVLEVLGNARATRYVKEQQPDGKILNVPREYSTVPYRVLGEAR